MTVPDEEYPDVDAEPYELRFTRCALEDIRVDGDTPAGSLRKIRETTPWPDIVTEFIDQRTRSPHSTGGYLARMGRPDIAELHSTSGGRGATWYDKENEVVWFVGFTPQHEYTHLEARAASNELLPSEEDLAALFIEREERDFKDRIKPDLYALLSAACSSPGSPIKGRVGQLLRLEVTAIVVEIEAAKIADLFVIVRLPARAAGKPPPPGWPGSHLQERLAELLCAPLDTPPVWDAPSEIPDGQGGMRPVIWEEELPILLASCDISDLA